MNPFKTIQTKTAEARAREGIKPLMNSRMMRDILLEINQRGTEPLNLQSVPAEKREQVLKATSEMGVAGLKQSVVDSVMLDRSTITLVIKGEEVVFRYSDYNFEDIEETNYLPAVAEHLVRRMSGYYDMRYTRENAAAKKNGAKEQILQVFIDRHCEDTPFTPQPTQKRKLF